MKKEQRVFSFKNNEAVPFTAMYIHTDTVRNQLGESQAIHYFLCVTDHNGNIIDEEPKESNDDIL